MKFASRVRPVRVALTALVALVVGGMVALGFSAPAFAIPQTTVTVKVVNKAGTAVSASAVYPIEVANGAVAPGGADYPAFNPVSGKPGYFTGSVSTNHTYTLEIDPTGSSAANGTWQLLGGGQNIDQAKTFTPTGVTDFVTATFDNEGTITGKITSPTGSVLKGAEADVYYYDGNQWQLGSYALSGSTGIYTLTNLQPGSYRLKFWSPTGAYPPIYSGGSTSLTGASSVLVGTGKTVTVNAKFLSYTGSISGKTVVEFPEGDFGDVNSIATAYPVTPSGSPAVATNVDYGHPVASAKASSSGTWTISNLQPGTYAVHIEPYYYNENQTWVGASDPSDDVSSATIFTVTSGSKSSAGTTFIDGDDNGGRLQ